MVVVVSFLFFFLFLFLLLQYLPSLATPNRPRQVLAEDQTVLCSVQTPAIIKRLADKASMAGPLSS